MKSSSCPMVSFVFRRRPELTRRQAVTVDPTALLRKGEIGLLFVFIHKRGALVSPTEDWSNPSDPFDQSKASSSHQ